MVYFRFPFSDHILTADHSSDNNVVSFFSFDRAQHIHFKGNIKEISKEKFQQSVLSNEDISEVLYEFMPEEKGEYIDKIADVISFVKTENLSKLVISRRKLVKYKNRKLNLTQTFLNLCESYPNAFVYLFLENGKCWIGAFSEVLGKFNKETCQFETMSLAATLPLEESWNTKEIEEQKPVTDFIKTTLNGFSDQVEQSETYDHISGNIKHLRTDFKAKIKSEDVESIIEALHPTPAVCGIPKDFCKKAILEFEKYPRNFYSGFIKVETSQDIQYFVNLRCAEFLNNAAFIYVGGGITADSSPEKEWQETELKAEAILNNLCFSED
ncbi:chorismate-binding protein [Kaistella polysaccharea]|uniref:chorismate-binding protein n=1 Tax=Kaistella polysaccharea TaxID=2878534 RepID=UPI001CF2AABB|nr:chorismate-binding protein [Kaistella polysaccharea]